MIQPKETWTHDFCLLSSTEQDKTPSQEALMTLKEADLGRKKKFSQIKMEALSI